MADSSKQFQHYISQFLLKNFRAKRGEIWSYRFRTKEYKLEKIKKSAGVYNSWDSEFEESFSKVERDASKIIKRIIKEKRRRDSLRCGQVTLSRKESSILFNYLVWLTELQPERARFILNKTRNREIWEHYLSANEFPAQQKERHIELYKREGVIPSLPFLEAEQKDRLKKFEENFRSPCFLCASGEEPFILPGCYLIPIISENYKGGDPWKAVGYLCFPIAYDICLVLCNKTISPEETIRDCEKIRIEDVNRAGAVFAREITERGYIYGISEDILKETVETIDSRGTIAWSEDSV